MSEIFLLDAAGLELPRIAAARVLSVGERDRLATFSSGRRQREFLIGRLLLKSALTGFSTLRVKEFPCIVPKIEATGKPSLPGFNFNLSHAGEVFILAIGKESVGVDVEPVQSFDDAMAALCFSPPQQKKIADSPHPDRLATLLWCLREAEGKLLGTGLSAPEGACIRIHRKSGFVTRGGTSYAWALASSARLSRKPWNECRSQIDSLSQSFTGCGARRAQVHPDAAPNLTPLSPCVAV